MSDTTILLLAFIVLGGLLFTFGVFVGRVWSLGKPKVSSSNSRDFRDAEF